MVYIGAKVRYECPFFGDSIFLFLMYGLRCVFNTAPTPSQEGSYTLHAASLHVRVQHRSVPTFRKKTHEYGYHREKEIPGITARDPTIYKPTKVYERNCMIVILI